MCVQKYLSVKDAQALLQFENTDYIAASELLNWSCHENITENKEAWNYYQVLGQTHQTLTNIAVQSAAKGMVE